MNKLKFILIVILLSLLPVIMQGQPSSKRHFFPWKKGEKTNSGAFRNPEKIKKKQEAKEKKMKKDYAIFIRKSKKRSYAIQSPEVKARMKQNEKDTKSYYKSNGKKQSGDTKNARKKYHK